MKNKVFISLLSVLLIVGSFSTSVFASDSEDTSSQENAKILRSVEELVEDSDSVELIDVDELPEGAPVIEFETVEEFEKVLIDLEKENKENNTLITEENLIESTESEPVIRALASTVKVLTVIVKPSVNPLKQMTQPASITVDLGYSYSGGKFTSINSVRSHSSGFPTNWKQTSYSRSYYDSNRGVNMTINGYNQLGVVIGGQPIGTRVNDQLTFKYKLGGSTRVFDTK